MGVITVSARPVNAGGVYAGLQHGGPAGTMLFRTASQLPLFDHIYDASNVQPVCRKLVIGISAQRPSDKSRSPE
jgi:hypothetical protein